ncbi:MAG: DUF642 domain-containing protein [Luteolibacter sp.]
MKTISAIVERRADRGSSGIGILPVTLLISLFLNLMVSAFSGVSNGSFESGYAGWSTAGNQSIASVAPYAPSDGTKLVAFNNGNKSPNGVLSQTFATDPGQTYTLLFDVGILAYNDSEQRLRVELSGSSTISSREFVISRLGVAPNRWLAKSLSFTADSPATKLTFKDVSSTSANLDLLLDHVRIELPVARNLAVASSGVESVPVTVAAPDGSGLVHGVTAFSLTYDQGRTIVLTAPASVTTHIPYKGYAVTNRFVKWLRNGVDHDSNRISQVMMDGDQSMNAVFEPGPPIITEQPAGATVVEGSSLILHVAVFSPDTGYRWRFNGVEIPGAYSANYTISNVRLSQGGTYDVLIGDLGGSVVSAPAVLTVRASSFENAGFESNFDGWTASGNVRVQTAAPNQAPEGIRIVAFNAGNSAPNGVLSQTVATAPGVRYLLSFDMGVLAYNTNEQRLQIDLTGGDLLASRVFTLNGIGGGAIRWQSQRLSFVADSTATVVTFRDKSTTSNSIDLLLDNVRLAVTTSGFSLIPAGTFEMGSNPGETAHQPNEVAHLVTISNSFYFHSTEITWTEWKIMRRVTDTTISAWGKTAILATRPAPIPLRWLPGGM